QQGASLFNVVYAAISLALKKLGAPSQLIVGTPASGRLDAEFFDTVGYFTTLAMHVVHFDRAESVAELIAQVKNTINESLDYSDVPIDWVEDALLGERTDKHHLFEVMIQLHAKNKLHGELVSAQQAVRFEQVDPEKSESALGLQFEGMEERGGGEDRVR
ncbi:condensation domain-containing protein, partial [Salmonella enterica]|uniref:condensation domain-containing protein n=1 Tax=Salmonella enterica TaxID=28901 RepID=UPI000A96B3CF